MGVQVLSVWVLGVGCNHQPSPPIPTPMPVLPRPANSKLCTTHATDHLCNASDPLWRCPCNLIVFLFNVAVRTKNFRW